MTSATDKVREIRAVNPFPWREVLHPNGLVQIFDATGKEVPLFSIVAMSVLVTHSMAAQAQPAKE